MLLLLLLVVKSILPMSPQLNKLLEKDALLPNGLLASGPPVVATFIELLPWKIASNSLKLEATAGWDVVGVVALNALSIAPKTIDDDDDDDNGVVLNGLLGGVANCNVLRVSCKLLVELGLNASKPPVEVEAEEEELAYSVYMCVCVNGFV